MRTEYPPSIVHFTRAQRKMLALLVAREIVTPDSISHFYSARSYPCLIYKIRKLLRSAPPPWSEIEISTAPGMGHFLTKQNRVKLQALMAARP